MLQKQVSTNYVCYSPSSKQRQNGNSFSPSPRDTRQISPSINSSILNYTASEPNSARSVQISGVSLISNGNANIKQSSPIRQMSPQINKANTLKPVCEGIYQLSPQAQNKGRNQIRILGNESPSQPITQNNTQFLKTAPVLTPTSGKQHAQQVQAKLQPNLANNKNLPYQMVIQPHIQQNQFSNQAQNIQPIQNLQSNPQVINNGTNNIVYINQETQKRIEEQNKKFNKLFSKDKGQHNPNNFSFSQKNQQSIQNSQIQQQNQFQQSNQQNQNQLESSRTLRSASSNPNIAANTQPIQLQYVISRNQLNQPQQQQQANIIPDNSKQINQQVNKNQILRNSISQLKNIDENIQKQIKSNVEDKMQQEQNSSLHSETFSLNGTFDQTREILKERNLQNMINTASKNFSKAQSHEQKIIELQTDRSQLLKMIATKQLEIDDLKQKNNQEAILIQRIDKLVEENEQLNFQNQKLAQDYQQLNERVNQNLKYMKEYNLLNEENQSLCEKTEEYQELLDKLEIKITILSNENNTLLKMMEEKQEQIELLKQREEEHSQSQNSMTKFQDLLEKKNQLIKQLEKQLREAQEQNKVLNNEIIFQQEQFTEDKLNEAVSNIVSEKNTLIEQISAENSNFKIKIKSLLEENKSLQEKVAKQNAIEWYADQLKTTKETIEENQMIKDRQLIENKELIQEMKKIIDLNKEQLELKENKILQLKQTYDKEKEAILRETEHQINEKLEEIKAYTLEIEKFRDELVLTKKQLMEEKNRADYFQDQFKIYMGNQEHQKFQQEQIIMNTCLENKRSQQDKIHFLNEIEDLKNKNIAVTDKLDQMIAVNDNLTEVLKEKSQEIQELLIEKDKLLYEREQEQIQLERIQNNLHQLEEERENFLKETQDVYELKEKVSHQETNRYKQQIEDLKLQIQQKEFETNEQFQKNLNQLEQSQQEIIQLKDQINKLNYQISQIQSEDRLKIQERVHFDSTLLELQKINEDNQIEIANLKDKLLKLENQRDKLQRQLSEEKEENDLKFRKSEQNYENQIASLDTKYKRLLDEFKYLSESYEHKKQELNQFKEELPQIANKIKNEKIELTKSIEEKEKQLDILSIQNKVSNEKILDLESQVNIMINKNEQIQNTYLALQTQYQVLENKYTQQHKKIQQLEKQNDNTKSHLTISLQQAETQLSQTKMQIIELETKNKRLIDDISRANHLKQLMKDQMEDLEINFKKEMDEVREESIKDLNNKFEREKRELNFKIQKLGNQVRQLESDKDIMKQDLDAKQREVESITLQLQRVAEREKNLYQKQRLSQY
ncbi:hypothetical protein TTHERM_00672210 (macronuclear) [Tetrahymena thermophila SB210]|uniref:Uncharacterized protein n=1 Tax=Tetrahymena thermophila (strain SB210) TaxID=312017 RepID=Q23E34_TETTS|nr:hypothetical protein TTHERM_00672210 [Tetrahymena thermophila SB210]EAR94753.2 hypothetical protein TTHERM_00672210 [Tetrahymena thermophila SB210]|eukprot:XP_001014998.2 hypothetical protein TTHERM_00672210 [Tetrahymena thermophila SB210]